MKKIISTDEAPKAVGPYSQAVMAGGLLYISGQLPMNPETMKMVEGDIEEKTERCMENLLAILRKAGGDQENLIKVNIYTTDISLFGRINNVYSGYFKSAPPARAVVEVKGLPLGATIEIEGVAAF